MCCQIFARRSVALDVKIVWFCCQVAVCVQKRHKNTIFECSWFQKFNFDCLLLKLLIYSQTTENIFKGTQGFIHCLFKAASLATINKQMLSSLATYEALSLVITKPSFIWFGSEIVHISTLLENS